MPRLVLTTFTTLTLALGSSKVFAQPPTAFGNWTADQGTITTPCPNGFTCTPIAQDSGFLQRKVINPTTGEIFVQSILTDNGATGAPGALEFAMEDFVRINPGAQAADVQGMHMVVAEGELQPTASQASLPGGSTVTWQAGDTLVAGWLGTTGTGGTLGHQAYMNLTSGQQAVINDFSDPGPFGWPVDAFGPAPTLPAGTP